FTPDGKVLVVTAGDPKTLFDLLVARLDGSGAAKPLIRTPVSEYSADLSPDGRWIAYTSTETGPAIYVRPFPEVGGGRWQGCASGRCGRAARGSCSISTRVGGS